MSEDEISDTEAQFCERCTEDTCVEKGDPDMPPCGDDEEDESATEEWDEGEDEEEVET